MSLFHVISSLFRIFVPPLFFFAFVRLLCFLVRLLLCFIIFVALLWMGGAGCCSLRLRFPSVGGLVVRGEGGGGV